MGGNQFFCYDTAKPTVWITIPSATSSQSVAVLELGGGMSADNLGGIREELVGLDHSDVEHVRQGLVIHLRRSKTDQEGAGRKIGIPHGRTRWCPVVARDHWFARSTIDAGPIFRGVNRHGQLLDHRLSGEAVSLILKERAAAAGLDPAGFSGHSLRAGFATSAAKAGASSWKIRAQTGHASDAMLSRYLRNGELFADNAAGAVL